jgi:DNA polymerase-3 subunit delta'
MLFKEVIGQEDVKNRLRNSFHDGRIAHALMFLGPEGSGNLALALAFATYISCPNRTAEDACGKCPTCHKLALFQFADMNFSFPFFNKGTDSSKKTTCDDWITDFRVFLSQSAYGDVDTWRTSITEDNKLLHISVYEAANIVNKLSLKSYEGGYKFQVIWMADYLKAETANKLLKILEEPPQKTIFLLVANSIESILPTILSRVQTIHIPKLTDEAIAEQLVHDGVAESTATAIAHFADGNWWLANTLAHSEDPNEALALQFQAWMRFCYSKDVGKLVKWSDERHGDSRDDQKRFLKYALDQVRQNLMLNYVGPDFARLNETERSFSAKFARFINDTNAEEMMEQLSEAYNDVSRNAYSKMVFLDLSIKMHYLLTRVA